MRPVALGATLEGNRPRGGAGSQGGEGVWESSGVEEVEKRRKQFGGRIHSHEEGRGSDEDAGERSGKGHSQGEDVGRGRGSKARRNGEREERRMQLSECGLPTGLPLCPASGAASPLLHGQTVPAPALPACSDLPSPCQPALLPSSLLADDFASTLLNTCRDPFQSSCRLFLHGPGSYSMKMKVQAPS